MKQQIRFLKWFERGTPIDGIGKTNHEGKITH